MLPSRCLMFAGRVLAAPIPSLLRWLSLHNSYSLVYASLSQARIVCHQPPEAFLKNLSSCRWTHKPVGGHCRCCKAGRRCDERSAFPAHTHTDCKHTCDSSTLPFTPINGRGHKPFQYRDSVLRCDVADRRRRSASAVS